MSFIFPLLDLLLWYKPPPTLAQKGPVLQLTAAYHKVFILALDLLHW